MLGSIQEVYPDPVLTASLYLSNRLDDLVRFAIQPFWRNFTTDDSVGHYYLWLFRYGRCGEHLKVRVHGPPVAVPELRRLLEEAASVCFAHSSASVLPPYKVSKDAPPIDQEDRALENYQDQTCLWTHYERSFVSLGAKPLLTDDTYVGLFTRCLGMACEFLLSCLDSSADLPAEGFPHRFRQATLLNLILAALAVVGFTPEERVGYLRYHRDWLVWGLQVQKRPAWPSEHDILERLENGANRLNGATGIIRTLVETRWNGSDPEVDAKLVSWQRAVADLSGYLERRLREADGLLDPFADHPVFPSIFKVLHIAANQIGLKKIDEAFAYHLLLHATLGKDAGAPVIRRMPFLAGLGQSVG